MFSPAAMLATQGVFGSGKEIDPDEAECADIEFPAETFKPLVDILTQYQLVKETERKIIEQLYPILTQKWPNKIIFRNSRKAVLGYIVLTMPESKRERTLLRIEYKGKKLSTFVDMEMRSKLENARKNGRRDRMYCESMFQMLLDFYGSDTPRNSPRIPESAKKKIIDGETEAVEDNDIDEITNGLDRATLNDSVGVQADIKPERKPRPSNKGKKIVSLILIEQDLWPLNHLIHYYITEDKVVLVPEFVQLIDNSLQTNPIIKFLKEMEYENVLALNGEQELACLESGEYETIVACPEKGQEFKYLDSVDKYNQQCLLFMPLSHIGDYSYKRYFTSALWLVYIPEKQLNCVNGENYGVFVRLIDDISTDGSLNVRIKYLPFL